MNNISISSLRKLTGEQIKELMPVMVLCDNEPFGVLSKAEDVLFLGDLHIRVRKQFRAKEAIIRRGMPKPVRIDRPEGA